MIATVRRVHLHRMMGWIQKHQLKLFSTDKNADNLVLTKVEEGNPVAKMVLNRPAVNSLSLEMCQAISKSIKSIEADHPKVQALVLTSSNPSILSAGLDLTELYNPNPQRLPQFWTSFQQLFLDLYGSRLAVICAIEGHAPAAGCMLAMASDYRVMASPSSGVDNEQSRGGAGTIGLNESLFGIAAPPWLGQLMIRTIGFREAEEAMALGKLFSPDEALHLGLVDKIVPTDSVLDKSHEIAACWAKIPAQARMASKMLCRKEYMDDLILKREQDTKHFCTFIQNDIVQAGLGAYLDSLRNK